MDGFMLATILALIFAPMLIVASVLLGKERHGTWFWQRSDAELQKAVNRHTPERSLLRYAGLFLVGVFFLLLSISETQRNGDTDSFVFWLIILSVLVTGFRGSWLAVRRLLRDK
jgi:drug/metabolite transporter (DMT)-like permease